jgi:hypothetical protein
VNGNSFPQWGRGSYGASAASMSASKAMTSVGCLRQVKRDQRPAGGIGNGVEGVSRTESFDPRMVGDELLDLGD